MVNSRGGRDKRASGFERHSTQNQLDADDSFVSHIQELGRAMHHTTALQDPYVGLSFPVK